MNPNSDPQHRTRPKRPASAFTRIERLPPAFVFLYLALLAITIMFAVLVAAYVHARLANGMPTGRYPLPRYFSLSTIVLVVSSYVLAQAPRLYPADDVPNLVRCLGATLLLGGVFAGLQVLGWRELRQTKRLLHRRSQRHLRLPHLGPARSPFAGRNAVYAGPARSHRPRQPRRHPHPGFPSATPTNCANCACWATYWHFVGGLWAALFGRFCFCIDFLGFRDLGFRN